MRILELSACASQLVYKCVSPSRACETKSTEGKYFFTNYAKFLLASLLSLYHPCVSFETPRLTCRVLTMLSVGFPLLVLRGLLSCRSVVLVLPRFSALEAFRVEFHLSSEHALAGIGTEMHVKLATNASKESQSYRRQWCRIVLYLRFYLCSLKSSCR